MNTYIAIFRGRQIRVKADSMNEAVLKARKELKVSKSNQGLLAVVLTTAAGASV